ncbi:MAG TPA: cyclase, partial [Mycobacterium sp.]|nr:cyclase [Mycobacterium sp.]
ETDVGETEDHPEELVHDEPEYDMPDDDEPYDSGPEYAEPAEEAAMHILDEQPEPDR